MKNMDRWLGDGGMAIIAAIGASFDGYGYGDVEADGGAAGGEPGSPGGGWASAAWVPTALACNPHGIVQAGVHSVLLDAAMNFAINAGLEGRDRSRATLEMKTETMRVANAGDQLRVRGEVVRMARQVAYAEAAVRDQQGRMVSRSTATFLLHRAEAQAPESG
jgi:uncharacterized protein (TIGR00369 family)